MDTISDGKADPSVFPIDALTKANARADALDAQITRVLNSRVSVENRLLYMAAGKLPLPTAAECREMALLLGNPTSQTNR